MLRIWMGRANTGKSGRVLEAIRGGGGGALLLVPEHASHAAELDLCRAFGPAAGRTASGGPPPFGKGGFSVLDVPFPFQRPPC